jgi:FecR protein
VNNDCQAWMALSDKAALGDILTAEERAFSKNHLAGCRACSTEASVWNALEEALDDPRLLTDSLGSLTGVLGRGRVTPTPRWLTAKAKRVLSFAAAALVLALPVSLVAHAWRAREAGILAKNSGDSAAPAVGSLGSRLAVRVAFVTGNASINGRPASAGQRLELSDVLDVADGYACLLAPPGVTVCVDHHSRLQMDQLDAATRRFRLSAGHALARLEHQPLGSTFGFETSAGSVVAKGTVFSVEVLGDQVRVRVHEGTVIGTHGGQAHAFAAPVAALLSAPLAGQLPEEGMASDARLLEFARNFSDRGSSVLEVTATDGGEVTLGDSYLGSSPLSALVVPGSYRLVYEHAGLPPIAERLTLADGEHAVRNYENPTVASQVGDMREGLAVASAPLARAGAVPGSATGAHPASSPVLLLQEARELRAEGRFGEAGSVYRRLLREHAGSGEARAALVSLGELQLSQLGDASGALKSFEAYLRAGGALAQEASYGKIRALRALGRSTEAQAAVAAFLSAYPQSVQAGALRKD